MERTEERRSNHGLGMTKLPDCEFIIIEHEGELPPIDAPKFEKSGWETVVFNLEDEKPEKT